MTRADKVRIFAFAIGEGITTHGKKPKTRNDATGRLDQGIPQGIRGKESNGFRVAWPCRIGKAAGVGSWKVIEKTKER